MRARVLRPRGVRKASRVNDALRCCLPPWGTASALRSKRLSRLNGRPARAPVNAPAMPLRTPQYDSGSVWFAIPSPYGSLIHYSSPAYRRFPPTHPAAASGYHRPSPADAGMDGAPTCASPANAGMDGTGGSLILWPAARSPNPFQPAQQRPPPPTRNPNQVGDWTESSGYRERLPSPVAHDRSPPQPAQNHPTERQSRPTWNQVLESYRTAEDVG